MARRQEAGGGRPPWAVWPASRWRELQGQTSLNHQEVPHHYSGAATTNHNNLVPALLHLLTQGQAHPVFSSDSQSILFLQGGGS